MSSEMPVNHSHLFKACQPVTGQPAFWPIPKFRKMMMISAAEWSRQEFIHLAHGAASSSNVSSFSSYISTLPCCHKLALADGCEEAIQFHSLILASLVF